MKTIFSPIDIPQIDTTNIISFFQKNKVIRKLGFHWDTYTVRKSAEAIAAGNSYFHHLYNPNLNWEWDEKCQNEIPELIDLLNLLPYEKIFYVNLITNIYKDVPIHKDFGEQFSEINLNDYEKNWKEFHSKYEPCAYRLVLDGDYDNLGFYISPNNDEKNATFIQMPKDTNVFAFNSTTCYHGAVVPQTPKILCYISGWIDPDKHNKLYKSSIKKYEEHQITC